MKFQQCSKCHNDLPFSAASTEVICPFCGTINLIENKKFKVPKVNKLPSTDSTTVVISTSFTSDSGGDC